MSGPATARVLVLVKDAGRPETSGPRELYWGLRPFRDQNGFRTDAWLLDAAAVKGRGRVARWLRRDASLVGYGQAPRLLERLSGAEASYDVVLSFTHASTVSVLSLRRAGRWRPKIVALALGLPDRLERMAVGPRLRELDLLKRADRLLAMSPAEVCWLQAAGLMQTTLLPFGVDTAFWSPSIEAVEDYVFSPGSDPGRDFDTLVRACPYPLRLMTRRPESVTVALPATASFVQGDTAALKTMYGRSRLVVVPLHDRLQPSGQNTMLQAMAMAKPMVATRTRGFWSDELRDGENCLLVPPGDVYALRRAIERLYGDEALSCRLGLAARATACSAFDADCLGASLSRHVEQVLGACSPA